MMRTTKRGTYLRVCRRWAMLPHSAINSQEEPCRFPHFPSQAGISTPKLLNTQSTASAGNGANVLTDRARTTSKAQKAKIQSRPAQPGTDKKVLCAVAPEAACRYRCESVQPNTADQNPERIRSYTTKGCDRKSSQPAFPDHGPPCEGTLCEFVGVVDRRSMRSMVRRKERRTRAVILSRSRPIF